MSFDVQVCGAVTTLHRDGFPSGMLKNQPPGPSAADGSSVLISCAPFARAAVAFAWAESAASPGSPTVVRTR